MASAIALNKPSGGQLILSPEDGTSTETVTIPSDGIMKGGIVGYEWFKTGTNFITSSGSYVATPLTVTINKKYSDSYIVINASPNVQGFRAGAGQGKTAVALASTSGYSEDYQCAVRSYDSGDTHVVAANLNIQGIDTTSLTGDLTYTIYIALLDGSAAHFNIDNTNEAYSTIHVYEVKQ